MEALQSTEQRQLMDLVDQLRRSGLNSVLQLPQIVVCGDQSSGKSSVLEAITEIPFPRKENLCTRFATEIIMRRDFEPAILCKINPDDNRPEDEQKSSKIGAMSVRRKNVRMSKSYSENRNRLPLFGAPRFCLGTGVAQPQATSMTG
jgi:GTPase SAR1 family protein